MLMTRRADCSSRPIFYASAPLGGANQSCSQDRKFRDQDQQCQDQDRDQDRHLQDQDQDQVAVHNKMRVTYKLLNMLSTTED